jgi:hypothetical protein
MRRRLFIMVATMLTVALVMGMVSAVAVSAGKKKGCTPGYWKQSQHFDSWADPYDPGDKFDDFFEDAFGEMTLLQVLQQGGGGLNALGRHTVAALLNSASLDYEWTSAQVIAAFNAVYPGGDYAGLKDDFEAANEAGCSLN